MKPRISVVVPVYNVEPYLDACLRSLAGQTMPDLDVVIIDDGSTDESAAVARQFASADPRFRLISQANAGLGAARNAGVRAALEGTEFLAFVDSDDVVPPDAYERMLDALDSSGSDFATGNVLRLRANGRLEQSPMFRRPMARSRRATHITRDDRLLGDRIACNKVFRRDFWERHAFAFPEGVLYEDIAVVLPAHHLASSVDVLSRPVYHWRDRDGSITAHRAVVQGVRDRTTAVRTVSQFLAAHYGARQPQFKRRFDLAALSGDLWLFMEALPYGDDEYRQAFLDHANAFAGTVDPSVLWDMPPHLRVKWYLVRKRRLDELLGLLAFEKDNARTFAVRGVRPRRAHYPVLAEGTVPRGLLTLKRRDLPLVARLDRAEWRDGRLHLRGYAYIRNVPADSPGSLWRTAWLRAGKRRRPVAVTALKVHSRPCPEATYRSGQELHGYDWAGFDIVIDPARIGRVRGRATWKLGIAVLSGGVLRYGGIGAEDTSTAPAVHYLDSFTRVVPSFDKRRLQLTVERIRGRLTGHFMVGTQGGPDAAVRLTGKLRDGPGTRPEPSGTEESAGLRLTHWHSSAALTVPVVWEEHRNGRRRFHADVPLGELEAVRAAQPPPEDGAEPRRTDPWTVRLVLPDGGTHSLAVRDLHDLGGYPLGTDPLLGGAPRELCVGVSAHGNLLLSDQTVQPVADRVTWTDDGELVLEGTWRRTRAGWKRPARLVLQHSGNKKEADIPVAERDGWFRVAFRPDAATGAGRELSLEEGNWYVFFRQEGATDNRQDAPMRLLASEHNTVPQARTVNGREYTVQRRFHDRLLITSGSVLSAEDRGNYRQRRLRAGYVRQRTVPLRETVLYSSFHGRQYSDSPQAVHEELAARRTGLEHLWSVDDQQAGVPGTARAVVQYSAEWYAALARSRYIVTNTQLPEWFERRDGQYVVQTWHGTPLKRIGRDLAGTEFSNARYIDSLPGRARQWNLLVSPNRFSTPILRRAFGYDGEVLECGYPRNDVLYARDRERKAQEVRRELGIPEGRRVVLYAPTWREDRPLSGGRYSMDLRLDLQAAEKALGGECVLLVRKHYLVTDRVPETGSGFVRDVSEYGDVTLLLLISDVLVTDYSSLMFDFAGTGRPMLFFTYDLDHYRDTLRGFYVDFEASAPGPLLQTGGEVIEALRDPQRATAHHQAAYDRFRATFCDLDDGTAAARVADRMLASRRTGAS